MAPAAWSSVGLEGGASVGFGEPFVVLLAEVEAGFAAGLGTGLGVAFGFGFGTTVKVPPARLVCRPLESCAANEYAWLPVALILIRI